MFDGDCSDSLFLLRQQHQQDESLSPTGLLSPGGSCSGASYFSLGPISSSGLDTFTRANDSSTRSPPLVAAAAAVDHPAGNPIELGSLKTDGDDEDISAAAIHSPVVAAPPVVQPVFVLKLKSCSSCTEQWYGHIDTANVCAGCQNLELIARGEEVPIQAPSIFVGMGRGSNSNSHLGLRAHVEDIRYGEDGYFNTNFALTLRCASAELPFQGFSKANPSPFDYNVSSVTGEWEDDAYVWDILNPDYVSQFMRLDSVLILRINIFNAGGYEHKSSDTFFTRDDQEVRRLMLSPDTRFRIVIPGLTPNTPPADFFNLRTIGDQNGPPYRNTEYSNAHTPLIFVQSQHKETNELGPVQGPFKSGREMITKSDIGSMTNSIFTKIKEAHNDYLAKYRRDPNNGNIVGSASSPFVRGRWGNDGDYKYIITYKLVPTVSS